MGMNRLAIMFKVRKANGVHTPKVSTTKGIKSAPAFVTDADASHPWPTLQL